MTPRLPSSTKWTEIPKELAEKIREVFAQQFSKASEVGEFIVEGRIYQKEILLRIGYLPHGRLRQLNLEASIEYAPEGLAQKQKSTMEPLYVAVDTIGSVMDEVLDAVAIEDDDILENEELDLPRDWTSVEFDQDEVFLKFSTINSKLEAEADRLLGDASNLSNRLVHDLERDEDLH